MMHVCTTRLAIAVGITAVFLVALIRFEIVAVGEPLQQSPQFEVASIKRCEAPPAQPGQFARGASSGGGAGNGKRFSADRIVLQCVRMRMVILNAYLEYGTGKKRRVEDVTWAEYAAVSSRQWSTPIEGTPPW